jgi:hypothetical protein
MLSDSLEKARHCGRNLDLFKVAISGSYSVVSVCQSLKYKQSEVTTSTFTDSNAQLAAGTYSGDMISRLSTSICSRQGDVGQNQISESSNPRVLLEFNYETSFRAKASP